MDGGGMNINAEETEVTISDARISNGTYPIANKKVTVIEHTFDLSALLK